MKYYHIEKLSEALSKYHAMAVVIQRLVRGWLARKEAEILRERRREAAVIKLQGSERGITCAIHVQCAQSDLQISPMVPDLNHTYYVNHVLTLGCINDIAWLLCAQLVSR